MLYPYPTEYNKLWENQTNAVRDIFWSASRSERRQYALSNPTIFGEQYIKPYIRLWNTNTAKHQYYMLYESLTCDNIIIHIPVEHAKSTWFSLVLPLWFLINDRNTHGAIISNTATQAYGFLSAIKWHIEFNEKLHADFPDLKPDYKSKWSESEIMVIRDKDKQSKDSSIVAKGTGNAILGSRFEWVIADDICDLDNTASEQQRNKTFNWWNEIVDSRVIEGGRKIIIGTLQHNKDLLCTLSDNKSYKYINLKGLDKVNNIPLWGERWSVKRLLEKKKAIGTVAWNKVIQNDRSASKNKLLHADWINYYGEAEKYNFNIFSEDVQCYIAVDPAIADDKDTAEKKQLDKFALAVIGFDKVSKLIFLWEYYTGHLTFPEQLKIIEKYYLKYQENGGNVKKIGIELAAYQKALAQSSFLLDSLPPIEGVRTGKSSKAAKIEAFGVYSETKRFWVKREHEEYIDEFVEYEVGGRSPNILDACTVAIAMIKGCGSVSDIAIFKRPRIKNIW